MRQDNLAAYAELPDIKHEAAAEYVSSAIDGAIEIGELIGRPWTPPALDDAMHDAFCGGYEFAMRRRYPELLEENTQLHGRLFDQLPKSDDREVTSIRWGYGGYLAYFAVGAFCGLFWQGLFRLVF